MSKTFTAGQVTEALDTLNNVSLNISGFHSLLCLIQAADSYPTEEALDVLCDALKRMSETFDTALNTLEDAIRTPAVLSAVGK